MHGTKYMKFKWILVWINLAQYRVACRAFVKAVISLPGSLTRAEFLGQMRQY